MKPKSKEKTEKIFKQIKEWQKNPEFIRAAYEFIRATTGNQQSSKRLNSL